MNSFKSAITLSEASTSLSEMRLTAPRYVSLDDTVEPRERGVNRGLRFLTEISEAYIYIKNTYQSPVGV